MKNIAIAGIIFLAMIATYIYLEGVGTRYEYAEDGVQFVHKECETDSQCVWVRSKCACSCGGAINQQFAEIHESIRKDECEFYEGPHCKMECMETKAMCVNGYCENVQI